MIWYARGDVCIVEASRRTVVIKRFEPTEVFRSKEEAEAHGLELAKAWVDQRNLISVCFHLCPNGK